MVTKAPRHAAVVRVTHWLTVVAFVALLVTGAEIVITHPRFYWGESGNPNMRPLFSLPLPTSRPWVNNGFGTAMPDGNGWGRYLHFEAAWLAALTGAVYMLWGLARGHFLSDLVPVRGERSAGGFYRAVRAYLSGQRSSLKDTHTYNALQRVTYLAVVFVVFPLMVWTGLAMSPSFTAAVPAAVSLLGGRQSARTVHFLLTLVLMLFVVGHVGMVALAGFWPRTRAMIVGSLGSAPEEEKP
jgi:thiosulfate reductase cytochrome b subunit